MDLYNAEHFKKRSYNQLKMITVLFTQKNSIYEKLGCDCWNEQRNALNYTGPGPVIAHPPCRLWSRLRGLSKANPEEKQLTTWSLDLLRSVGGVLEHPAGSTLFPEYAPFPGRIDAYGGFTILIHQSWFGHKAEKKTFLYIVGCTQKELPPIPISFDCITHTIARSRAMYKTGKREVTKKERSATPEKLATWLMQVIEIIQNKKLNGNPPAPSRSFVH